jgi:hypothetical protein
MSEAKYNCKICKYSTNKKSSWVKHSKTKKHNNDKPVNIKVENVKNPPKKSFCVCGKSYKYRSGLSKHKSTHIKRNGVACGSSLPETILPETTLSDLKNEVIGIKNEVMEIKNLLNKLYLSK